MFHTGHLANPGNQSSDTPSRQEPRLEPSQRSKSFWVDVLVFARSPRLPQGRHQVQTATFRQHSMWVPRNEMDDTKKNAIFIGK